MAAKKKESPGFTQHDYAAPGLPDYVIAELRYDSSVVVAPEGKFAAPAAAEPKANALNQILGKFSIKSFVSHFALRPVPAAMATGTDTGSRNFEPTQGYLDSAPNGIGAMGVWGTKGGKGQ